MQWDQWPTGWPRPAVEEWKDAERLFHREGQEARERGYMGDCGHSLSFDMATVTINWWWHCFYETQYGLSLRQQITEG